MQRSSILSYILIIILVLMLFGYISLGDVLSVIFYIMGGIILLILLGVLFFRWHIARLQRRMEEQAHEGGQSTYRSNTYSFGGHRNTSDNGGRREGDVTLKRNSKAGSKRVNRDVGDYVDYQDIDEK